MAAPIYFIATENPDPKCARHLCQRAPGFGPELLNSPGAMPRACLSGPGGRAGFTLPGPGEPWQPGYYPDRQEWRKVEGLTLASDEPTAELWIGTSIEPGRSPAPGDFARSDAIPGHLVTLADDRDWLIPVCRKFGVRDVLPTRMRLDPRTGRWTDGDRLDAYRHLSRHAEHWFSLISETASQAATEPPREVVANIDRAEAAAIACEALAVNYRLNPILIDRLGLLTSTNVLHVLNAMIDMPGILELGGMVKAERSGRPFAEPTPNGSTTPSGGPAGTPTA